MIELKNIDFSYDEKPVLQNYNLKVRNGECVCLKGPSGCGKTTVFRLISGLETAQNGTVLAPQKISVVFQENRLLPMLSVKKNVFLAIEKEQRTKAIEMLKEAGLEEAISKPVAELSGGMKRRVAIVRALCFGGEALLLDEPFNAIDRENKQKMANLIKREFLDKGKSVLLSTHVDEDAELLSARIVVFPT